MQQNGWDYVPHVILGQFFRNSAWRKNITGVIGMPEVVAFWNMEKVREPGPDARLHRPPARLDGARDGHRRGVRVPAAASLARRSGRDHRGRQRDRANRSPASASSSASTTPLPVQFFRWVAAVLQGDLGISIFSNEPVAQADQPAHRADAVARAHHADRRGHARGDASACSRPGRSAPGSTAR